MGLSTRIPSPWTNCRIRWSRRARHGRPPLLRSLRHRLPGLARAVTINAQAGGVVQGGSTLTQQLAKNLFLSNERTIERKVKEAFLAVWLECNLTKKEILRLYLDRAYMGGGTFGAAAAAQFYFGKSITDINLAESAMLAGLFKAPARYAPHVNLPAARARANEVLTNLVQGGLMTEGQVVAARLNPASVIDRAEVSAPDFFLDWAFDEVQRIAKPFAQHSLIVRTTIDTGLQHAAEEAIESSLRQYGESYRVKQGALVMIETGGAVRAMVGGRDYGESQFNRATKALRQPGSSFKAYTYAAAMEKGLTPKSVVVDAPITWGRWSPQNYGRKFSGRITLLDAIARSINTVPVRLAKETARHSAHRRACQGHGRRNTDPSGQDHPARHVRAHCHGPGHRLCVFPAGGLEARRHGISQILNYDGDILYDFNRDAPPAKRVLSEKATAEMNYMLTQIPIIGTARKAALSNGIVAGGKTGTTQSYRDAWFVGFTGDYTTAVWYGNDDYTSTNEMTGGSLPAMTFKRLMDYANRASSIAPFRASLRPNRARRSRWKRRPRKATRTPCRPWSGRACSPARSPAC